MNGEEYMKGKVRKVFSTGSLAAARRHAFALLALGAGMVLLGSDKSPLVPRVQSLVRRAAARLGMTRGDAVTPDDIARGYRILDGDGGSILQMPPGSITNGPLRLRGGYDWAFRVERDDWSFPTRDGIITGVTVLARGEVRPDVGTLYFPVPIPDGVSLLPQARWGLLPNGGGSVFSHAVTNDSLLLDWRNALVDRDPSSPTNLQLELRGDGSFVWRTDDASTSYLPVLPFDWDGDGLENSVDPEPLLANPIDAHGTPAEWFRIVCSNVFEIADNSNIETFPDSSIPEGIQFKPEVNSNAYYFVDVVATNGPAPIYFTPDRESRLGAPVVVALPGETNHVPLLMGIEYSVTSTVPITVSAPDAMCATVIPDTDHSARVKWPLDFSYSVSGGSYVVSVGPFDPGGTIEWQRTSSLDPFNISGGAQLLSSTPSSGCGFTTGERSLTFTCANCSCAGCTVSGVFCIEEASHDLGSFCCGCVYDPHDDDDDPEDGHEPVTSPDSPNVTVRFSQPVVIFEDAYFNTPSERVEKRSLSTTVEVEAYGGSDGGVVVVTLANSDKLECTSGPSLPTSFMVEPYSHRSITVGYQGNHASGSAGDIVATAQIGTASASASATAVEVEIRPKKQAPENSCVNRHTFGVYELVDCLYRPSEADASWTLEGGGTTNNAPEGYVENQTGKGVLRCPLTGNDVTIKVEYGNATYYPTIQLKEPENIVAERVDYRFPDTRPIGAAGNVALLTWLYVYPKDVNFEEIALIEIPWRQGGSVSGYFAQPSQLVHRYHDENHGAGRWKGVSAGNFWSKDMAGRNAILDWSVGERVWDVPIGWNTKGTHADFTCVKMIGTPTTFQHKTILDTNGTLRVEKFGHWVSRERCTLPEGPENGRVFLDGAEQDWVRDLARWPIEDNDNDNDEDRDLW